LKPILEKREPDIAELKAILGGGCPHFELHGKCPFGILCRVGEAHINLETGESLTNKEFVDSDGASAEDGSKLKSKPKPVLNLLSRDVQFLLRKNKYPFQIQRHFQNNNNGDPQKHNKHKKPVDATTEQGVDSTKMDDNNDTNDDLSPLPAKERKLIDFSNKVYVAPLTTVGNLPFRRIMKHYGADITCGEMAVGANLLTGQMSEWALLKRHVSEDVFGVQVACGHADMFGRVAELIENECTVDFMDLNLGCPIDLICKKGSGAALMQREHKLKDSLKIISKVTNFPFTVKMRTGWDEKKPFAHQLLPKIQSWEVPGLAAVMIHGRSRLQRYTKVADWNYIGNDVLGSQTDEYPRVPLIGNGDIFSYTDYIEHVEGNEGLCKTAMLARGALIKPWLPTEIKERRHWDISASERLDLLKDFVKFGLEHWGSDQQGVNNTRRFLLEFLSFLYRYIPVGLLERVPQQMNERPPKYIVSYNPQDSQSVSVLNLVLPRPS
jgi:tRNA-dihydrouridine synthase 3